MSEPMNAERARELADKINPATNGCNICGTPELVNNLLRSLADENEKLAADLASRTEWLDQSGRQYSELASTSAKIVKELAQARAECEEQARLNGMGAEREAGLLSKVERLEKSKHDWLTDNERIRAENAKLRSDCVNRHADAERLVEWVNDPNRKPAIVAFTEGPERQVAYAVDERLEAENAKLSAENRTLREEVERAAFRLKHERIAHERSDADNARLRELHDEMCICENCVKRKEAVIEMVHLHEEISLQAEELEKRLSRNVRLRAVVERLREAAMVFSERHQHSAYDVIQLRKALAESAEVLKGEKTEKAE